MWSFTLWDNPHSLGFADHDLATRAQNLPRLTIQPTPPVTTGEDTNQIVAQFALPPLWGTTHWTLNWQELTPWTEVKVIPEISSDCKAFGSVGENKDARMLPQLVGVCKGMRYSSFQQAFFNKNCLGEENNEGPTGTWLQAGCIKGDNRRKSKPGRGTISVGTQANDDLLFDGATKLLET